MDTVELGTLRTTRGEFDTATGVPADPGTVTLTITRPDGTTVVHTHLAPGSIIVRDSAGRYRADVLHDTAGLWWLRWAGSVSGPVGAVEEMVLVSAAFSQPYATVRDVANVIPHRTVDLSGTVAGTFTATTTPTAAAVASLLAGPAAEMAARIGAVPPERAAYAAYVNALGTAALVELAYYPDNSGASSPAAALRRQYEQGLEWLESAVEGPTVGAATFSFPEGVPRTTLTERW